VIFNSTYRDSYSYLYMELEIEVCHWCKHSLTEDEQIMYECSEGNCVSWCGLDKFPVCDTCMETMCEICKGPCEDICSTCNNVCHSYLCDTMTTECNHRCACKNPPKDGLEVVNPVPFEITLENLTNYTKTRLQDEKVKYGLARCENETKDKTISKLTIKLQQLQKNTKCSIKLDDGQAIDCIYPQGKTRMDLNKVLNDFFNN